MEGRQSKIIYVDIDGTICQSNGDYISAIPLQKNIDKVNKLFNQGHRIIYYTARGQLSKKDWSELTQKQLSEWGCHYHELIMNHKPHYDLYICDKSMRIEEI